MTRASVLMSRVASMRNRIWGEEVTYVRNSTKTELTITARKAGLRTAGPEGEDVVIEVELFLWIVAAVDLVDAGEQFEPTEQDHIVAITPDAKTVTYRVGTYGNEQCFEPADSQKSEYVIRTKIWSET